MYRRSFDLIVVIAAAVSAMCLALVGVEYMLPSILALLLVLVLPGYALTAALFPEQVLRTEERWLVIPGLSVTAAVLGGFVLNWTPWRLSSGSWAMLLGGLTVAASMAALLRRQKTAPASMRRLHTAIKPRDALLFGAAALVVVVAVVIARGGAIGQPRESFTQLWILPAGEANQDAVRLGISNMEPATMSYRLQVYEGPYTIREWPVIVLEPSEKWEYVLALPPHASSPDTIRALLYRVDEPEVVYRQGELWRGR